MEVKLQCGDSITIPEGCKAIVKDGSVVFEREQNFKDGDILIITENGHRRCVFIYKNTDEDGYHSCYAGVNTGNSLVISKFPEQRWGDDDLLDYATDKEKQLLFDKMKEKRLQWNAEEKRIEKIRWRAKEGEEYSYVNSNMEVSSCRRPKKGDYKCDYEGNSYISYNYFHTQEQATEAAKRVKETLRKYHEEIGE